MKDADKGSSGTGRENVAAMALAHEMRTSLISASYIYQDILRKYADTLSSSDQQLLKVGIETNAVKIAYAGEFLERLHGVNSPRAIETFTLGTFIKMLEHMVRAYEARAKEKGIAYIENIKVDMMTEANFDKTRLYSVVETLLDNAIKYSLQDPRKITLTVENDPRSLHISVRDSGIGIPDSERTRIFERFFRASNARAQSDQEGGVGLYLSQQHVTAEGGTMRFESEENKGTTFFVTVPLIRREVVL